MSSRRPFRGGSIKKDDDALYADDKRRPEEILGVVGNRRHGSATDTTMAKSDMKRTRRLAQHARSVSLQCDAKTAYRASGNTRPHAPQANRPARPLPWNIASVIPQLGRPFNLRRQVTDLLRIPATDARQTVIQTVTAIAPDLLYAHRRVEPSARPSAPTYSRTPPAVPQDIVDNERSRVAECTR